MLLIYEVYNVSHQTVIKIYIFINLSHQIYNKNLYVQRQTRTPRGC